MIILLITLNIFSKFLIYFFSGIIKNVNLDFCSIQGIRDFCHDLHIPADQPLAALGRWTPDHVYGFGECRDTSYNTLIETNSNTEWGQIGTLSGSKFH